MFAALKSNRLIVAIVRWFDTSVHQQPAPAAVVEATPAPSKEDLYKIDWVRVTPFFLAHAACLLVFVVGWSWTAVGAAIGLYLIRMFAITGFYHRYFSHKTFKTSRPMQFILGLVGNSAMQRGPLWWAAHHRKHHQHSDQEDDVHSPHQHTFMWSHMLWITNRENFKTDLKSVPDLAQFPELVFLDRFDFLVPTLLALATLLTGFGLEYWYPELGVTGLQFLVWAFFISTIVLFHGTCTINSLSHLFGTKRFKTKDESRNNPVLAVITLGEGWHNNHHFYATSARQGFYWYEYDITYYGLVLMSWLGLIWDIKPVPARVYEEAARQ